MNALVPFLTGMIFPFFRFILVCTPNCSIREIQHIIVLVTDEDLQTHKIYNEFIGNSQHDIKMRSLQKCHNVWKLCAFILFNEKKILLEFDSTAHSKCIFSLLFFGAVVLGSHTFFIPQYTHLQNAQNLHSCCFVFQKKKIPRDISGIHIHIPRHCACMCKRYLTMNTTEHFTKKRLRASVCHVWFNSGLLFSPSLSQFHLSLALFQFFLCVFLPHFFIYSTWL